MPQANSKGKVKVNFTLHAHKQRLCVCGLVGGLLFVLDIRLDDIRSIIYRYSISDIFAFANQFNPPATILVHRLNYYPELKMAPPQGVATRLYIHNSESRV